MKVLASALTIIVLLIGFLSLNHNGNLPKLLRSVAVDPPQPLEAVNLIDHSKQSVNLARFQNQWTFVFFGFTHCPHVCPATLAQLGVIKKTMLKKPEYGNNVQFFFISVDPERDTVERLADYMNAFDPEFVGMTGNAAAVSDFEKQLIAYHRIGEKDKQNNYDVDHSGVVYLIDPAARLTAKFLPPMDPSKVVEQFYQLVTRYSQV